MSSLALFHGPFSYHRDPPSSPTATSPRRTRLAAHSSPSHPNSLLPDAQADELRSHAAALQGCAVRRALRCGQELHARLLRSARQPDTFLLDSLLNMYCKCGRLEDARRVFDGMPHRDVVAWTALLSAHTAAGDAEEALYLFCQMNQQGLAPNVFALSSVLKACSVMSSRSEFTRQVHAQVVKLKGLDDPYVGSSLVQAYTSRGEVDAAETVLLGLPERSDVSWNALLTEYARQGDYRKVMHVFHKLSEFGDEISKYTLPALLKCCVELGLAKSGQALHALVVKRGLETDDVLNNCLVEMYSRCLSAQEAYQVFVRIDEPDVVHCSAMISSFGRHGMAGEAFDLLVKMSDTGVKPNQYTFVGIAGVASKTGDANLCRCVHAYVVKSGLAMPKLVADAILNMYVKVGAVQDATVAFHLMHEPDTFSWNTFLSGFYSGSSCEQGLTIFKQMKCEDFPANKYTYVGVLRCCTSLMNLMYGIQVHACILKSGLQSDNDVSRMLLDMYAQSGSFTSACLVFDRLEERDAFSWTVIMSGYAKTDDAEKVMECFRSMLQENKRPNDATLAVSLTVSSDMASLGSGLQLHSWAIKSGWRNSSVVSGAVIDMYVKCGNITDAEMLFYESEKCDQVAWNTLICGYSQHGHGYKALDTFRRMVDDGKRPDDITFVGVLSACSHAGLLDEGRKYFQLLSSVYGITPTMEHYACMIDILSKAGRLAEAESLISQMPLIPDSSIWRTILGGCRIHGNVEIAERAAERLFELEPEDVSSSILLSNIYADLGRWSDVTRLRNMLLDHGVKKEPGCSWIEVNGQVQVFLSQDGCPKY
ncbi:pentatricopeptide repeat-containing protein [Hordeum vulgare]|uniref:Pentatricopeptide repeat-containing protein n=1 Tax=Hordeum vulgare subsp. vulgare TaxID=112509 RepID=M0WLZ8_HORVV|nr:pentatricopeptide repeat-containing protein At4g13650-like [Hordeum vulgare subsp. vulgare]KAE8799085.1 pentatricopeptide repeat-containing protein [Hordeum vulgare]